MPGDGKGGGGVLKYESRIWATAGLKIGGLGSVPLLKMGGGGLSDLSYTWQKRFWN